jgi:TolB-like protein/tetratricopeptide (TPR) repeat protein
VPVQPVERKLAAIFAADIAGYSRLMAHDEIGTLARLKACRAIIDGLIAAHRGRIFNTAGDSVVADFASAVDAVQCAVAVQEAITTENAGGTGDEPMQFRIGVHVGDVMVDGKNLLGDGVNIAARLEALAEPGAICVSAAARDQVGNKLPLVFDDLGDQQIKNIPQAIRVYRVQTGTPAAQPIAALALPDKPSIAVLPFQNMSGDPEQEYFADGMVEEIITALSRFRWLFVIARNSTFTYKGRAVEIRQVARELGVRYVLEGSVRKAGNRVRITAQLIDTASAAHVWADRFDGVLDDIFGLQDQVASSVVGAIDPKLLEAEIHRVKRKPTANLDAYDCFLRGAAYAYQWTKEGHEEALRLFYKAIELDPDYAQAYALATHCYCWRRNNGLAIDAEEESRETARLARLAVRLGKDDAFALCWAGYSLFLVVGEAEEGAALIDRAIALNPNLALGWTLSGWVKGWLDQPETAIEHLALAMRLSPLDPIFHAMESATASAHLRAGRYDEASQWAEKALRDQLLSADAAQLLVLSNVFAGHLGKAQQAMQRLREIAPARRISNYKVTGLNSPERYARNVDALRTAGMPE